MKKQLPILLCILAINLLFSTRGNAQDEPFTGVSFTVGWTTKQILEQPSYADSSATALSFDLSGCSFAGISTFFDLGFDYGLTVRSYNFKNMTTTEEDPFDIWKTRFDIHIGPAIRIGLIPNILDIVGAAKGSLGYAGMTDNGPKVNWGLNITGDLVIARIVSVGFNYRPFNAKLCSTEWSMDYNSNRYYQIKPSFEIKVGVTFLPYGDW